MKTIWLLLVVVAGLLLFNYRERLTPRWKGAMTTGPTPAPAPAPASAPGLKSTSAPTPAPAPAPVPEQIVSPSTLEKAQTITPALFATGTSTGGTSTSSMGPNSGGSTTKIPSQKVWGPEFYGVGMTAGADQGDTTKSKSYPFLIGPKGPESTRIDGVGIVPPSKNYQLATDGSLPKPESTGSAEGSQYLPNSRTPGDQDLIPDPYRVSSAFSTSTYSSKTEPVPFLTDFSAFQK